MERRMRRRLGAHSPIAEVPRASEGAIRPRWKMSITMDVIFQLWKISERQACRLPVRVILRCAKSRFGGTPVPRNEETVKGGDERPAAAHQAGGSRPQSRRVRQHRFEGHQ